MKLKLITATAPVFEGDVSSITIPGELGEFQVLPGHTEFVGLVASGTLSYIGEANGSYDIGAGHAEVMGDVVTVAVDSAVPTP